MENLPAYITILFVFATVVTIFLFYRATGNSQKITGFAIAWLIVQGLIGYSGFYINTDAMPPRFLLLTGPPVAAILLLFIIPAGRRVLNRMDIAWCTRLHTIRILVELVILFLFLNGQLPKLMTFEGRNFDILSGLTAPIIVILLNRKPKNYRKNSFDMELYLPGATDQYCYPCHTFGAIQVSANGI